MDITEFQQLLTIKERKTLDFKESPFLQHPDEIAAQFVSFANRLGGHILVGVRDDGTLEGKTFNFPDDSLRLSQLARDKCSPPVDVDFEQIQHPQGQVLVVTVKKRAGIPHAVVKRSGHEISERKYYIRSHNGKRLVDDRTLQWMFEHSEDPRLDMDFTVWFQYNRKRMSQIVPIFDAPPYKLDFSLTPFLQVLSEKDAAFLQQNEAHRVASLLIELLPYALLHKFSWTFSGSWLVSIRRQMGEVRVSGTPRAGNSAKVDPATLRLPPTEAVTPSLSFDLSKIIRTHILPFSMPTGTSIVLTFNFSQGHTISSKLEFIKEDAFHFVVSFQLSQWTVGPAPGHPIGFQYSGWDNLENRTQLQDLIASVGINGSFSATFAFPDRDDQEFDNYRDWAITMKDVIENDVDWGRWVTMLPPGKLYSIERDVKEILKRLRD